MRALSASVVVSSIVLGGCLSTAKAQNLDLDAPPALNTVASASSLYPSLGSPGVVFGVTLGELYTDNLKLAADGQPKDSSWITQIQPFIKAATSGPRFSGLVDYTLTGYLYPGESDANQLSQLLDAQGTFAIVQQHLFLDGTAHYGRQIIDNELPSGGGTFFLSGNSTNVASGTLSPYWIDDLGRLGSVIVRYTYGRVVYSDRGIPDTPPGQLSGIPNVTSNAAQFSLVGPTGQTWGWSLGYSEQRLKQDFGQTYDFATAQAGVSYQLNGSTQLLADVGKENNYLPDGTVDKLGASFWDAGFQWANNRDSLKVLAGHRFYGTSFQLAWTHHAARLTTNVSYVQQPTTYNQQLLGMNPGTGGAPPINGVPNIPSLDQFEPYLSKRLSASAVYLMPRGTLTLDVYDELRTYFQEEDAEERVKSASLSWLYNLGPFTSLTPSFNWQRYEFLSGQITTTRYAQLELTHQFTPADFGTARLLHQTSDVESASPGARGYDANVIFVQWTHLF